MTEKIIARAKELKEQPKETQEFTENLLDHVDEPGEAEKSNED